MTIDGELFDEPKKPARSRLEQNPGAVGRWCCGAPRRHDHPAAQPGGDRRYLGDPIGTAGAHRGVRLSPHRGARQDQPGRRLGHDPGGARLHATDLRVPRPVRGAEGGRREIRVRPVDAEQRLSDRDGFKAASAVPGIVRRETGADARPQFAHHAGGGTDPDQAAGADHRRRPYQACVLSGVSAGPECWRRAGVAAGKPGAVAAYPAVILRCAPLARLEGWLRAQPILRGSPKRLAPQDDVVPVARTKGYESKSALTFANTLRNMSGVSTRVLVL